MYVQDQLASLRPRTNYCIGDGGYCAQPPLLKNYGKQASPLQKGARSTLRGLRVGMVDSIGRICWGPHKPWIAHPAATATMSRIKVRGDLTQFSNCKPQGLKGTSDHGPCALDLGPLVLAL